MTAHLKETAEVFVNGVDSSAEARNSGINISCGNKYMVAEGPTVLFSTHITSDLERFADCIVYISDGAISYFGDKEEPVSLSKWYPDLKWNLALISFSFFFYGLMSLAMYPLLFRLGYQKGKTWGYYLPAILICLSYIAVLEYDILVGNGTFIYDLLLYASEHILAVSSGMFAAGGMLLGLSYLLSARLYGRREF